MNVAAAVEGRSIPPEAASWMALVLVIAWEARGGVNSILRYRNVSGLRAYLGDVNRLGMGIIKKDLCHLWNELQKLDFFASKLQKQSLKTKKKKSSAVTGLNKDTLAAQIRVQFFQLEDSTIVDASAIKVLKTEMQRLKQQHPNLEEEWNRRRQQQQQQQQKESGRPKTATRPNSTTAQHGAPLNNKMSPQKSPSRHGHPNILTDGTINSSISPSNSKHVSFHPSSFPITTMIPNQHNISRISSGGSTAANAPPRFLPTHSFPPQNFPYPYYHGMQSSVSFPPFGSLGNRSNNSNVAQLQQYPYLQPQQQRPPGSSTWHSSAAPISAPSTLQQSGHKRPAPASGTNSTCGTKSSPIHQLIANNKAVKQEKDIQDNIDESVPRDDQESQLLRELQQMGFPNKQEILDGIRRVKYKKSSNHGAGDSSVAASPATFPTFISISADEVMLDLISHKEDEEYTRQTDQARIASERSRKEEAKRRRLVAAEEKEQQLKESTLYEWRDKKEFFEKSWILHNEAVFDVLHEAIQNENDNNPKVKEALLCLLKLERDSVKWYKDELPRAFFSAVVNSNILSFDSTAELVDYFKQEAGKIKHSLCSLQEQKGGVPRLYLEAHDQYGASLASDDRNDNSSHDDVPGNNDDDDDDSVVLVVEPPPHSKPYCRSQQSTNPPLQLQQQDQGRVAVGLSKKGTKSQAHHRHHEVIELLD
ncbi:hypothetical protein ACA910_022580 [Epithemia clementina (nom. ined.)]